MMKILKKITEMEQKITELEAYNVALYKQVDALIKNHKTMEKKIKQLEAIVNKKKTIDQAIVEEKLKESQSLLDEYLYGKKEGE